MLNDNMTKKIKKISDWWGEFDCSSNRNMPKLFEWTSDNNYDYIIYVDNYIKTSGLNDTSKEKLGWLLESPQMNVSLINEIKGNLDFYRSHYKMIFTCLNELVELGDPFKYTISNAVPWIWERNRKIHDKTKLVSMIASNKSWLPGHINRLDWVDKLKNKVDLYGTGRPFQLVDKEDGLRDYMFSVSIENDYSDNYFTEKLTDNFVMGTVPIYLGSRSVVDKYFDSRGVIFLDDDPDLSSISEELYYSMLPYIKNNFDLAMKLPIAEDYIFENYLKL